MSIIDTDLVKTEIINYQNNITFDKFLKVFNNYLPPAATLLPLSIGIAGYQYLKKRLQSTLNRTEFDKCQTDVHSYIKSLDNKYHLDIVRDIICCNNEDL